MIFDLTEEPFWTFLTFDCLLWFRSVGRAKIILDTPYKLQVLLDDPCRHYRQW